MQFFGRMTAASQPRHSSTGSQSADSVRQHSNYLNPEVLSPLLNFVLAAAMMRVLLEVLNFRSFATTSVLPFQVSQDGLVTCELVAGAVQTPLERTRSGSRSAGPLNDIGARRISNVMLQVRFSTLDPNLTCTLNHGVLTDSSILKMDISVTKNLALCTTHSTCRFVFFRVVFKCLSVTVPLSLTLSVCASLTIFASASVAVSLFPPLCGSSLFVTCLFVRRIPGHPLSIFLFLCHDMPKSVTTLL